MATAEYVVPGDLQQLEKTSFVVAEEEVRLLNDVVRSTPTAALKDLLSLGVCVQCIIRLFGKHGPIFCTSSRVLSLFSVEGLPKEESVCKICYGILQLHYADEKEGLVKKECPNDLAVGIVEMVRSEGYQAADGFLLEVSIPQYVNESEAGLRLYLKEKYSSEVWYQELLRSNAISVKDAFKLSMTKPLEMLLGASVGSSSLHIRLTYSSSEMLKNTENGEGHDNASKRRKTNSENGIGTRSNTDHPISEADLVTGKYLNTLPDKKVSACCLAINCYRAPICIGGRYLKFSRNVSQTRWIIEDERMGEASVEEIVGGSILPLCRGDSYKFHAAGREDIDVLQCVRMLGSGRPFQLEIQNARVVPSEASLKEMQLKINGLEGRLVKVKNLKVVDGDGWMLMREGEADKQKQYAALVWISRLLKDEDLEALSSLKDMKVVQRTPVRVLHRRSPLDREKTIHWMNVERIAGSEQYFLLHLCTQAGTYIKEFVHGDLGRTQPSLGSILGCRAEILQLDVTEIKMDCYLD